MSTTLERLVKAAGGLDALPRAEPLTKAPARRPGRPRKVAKNGLDVKTKLDPLVAKAFQDKIKERQISMRDGLREAVERYVAEAS